MKPLAATPGGDEGMLEYLEEIIGSNRLQLPIDKIRFRLGKIDEKVCACVSCVLYASSNFTSTFQRALQLTRVNHAESEKLELEPQARKLIEQLRVDNAIALLNNKILSVKK